MDVAQTVVSPVASAFLEAGAAGRQVELVMHDEDFLGQDLVEAGDGSHAFARGVHVGLRPHEVQFARAGVKSEKLGFQAWRGVLAAGHLVGEPGAGIVAGGSIFGAGIAEPDDQTDGAHANGHIEDGKTARA